MISSSIDTPSTDSEARSRSISSVPDVSYSNEPGADGEKQTAHGAADSAPGSAPEPAADPQAVSMPRRAINKASQIRRQMPKSLKLKLKILLSLVMFASLPFILKVDLRQTWEVAAHSNLWILAGTTVVFIASIVLNAKRWQLLTRAVGFNKTFGELVEYCYSGLYFNLFLPSTVGGDFVRTYYLAKGTNKHAEAFYSVLADRISGLAVLFVSAAAGLILGPGGDQLDWKLKFPVFLGTFGLFAILPFMPHLTRQFLGEKSWLTRQFNSSGASIFWQDNKLILSAVAWSVLTQLILVFCHMGIALALGLGNKIPLWYYFVFYPCVAVLGFVTPSFNGIGIREYAYTYFLVAVGVDRATALTFAFIWLALTTLLSLFGGLVYVVAKLSPPPRPEEE